MLGFECLVSGAFVFQGVLGFGSLVSGGGGGGVVGGRERENTKISAGPKRAQNRRFHIRNERLFGFGSPRPVFGLPRPGACWVLGAWYPEPLFFKES